jgi:Secretion system C-terminal sorting domain
VYIFNQPVVTPDFGMVTMDCARLIRNGNGIAGDMVTLNIDEGINSNNTHVNTFINYRGNQTGYLFNISYDNSSANTLGFDCQNLDPAEILATHNYWDKGCPLVGIDYLILTNTNVNNLDFTGLLYTDPIMPSAPNDCPTALHPLDQVDLTELDDPTKQGVINIDEKQYVTLKQYWTAWQAFAEEKDDEASKWFAPLAAVTREQHDKMENRYAQHYIDVAKVMTTATGYLDGLGADTKGQNPKDLTKNFWITDAQRGELGETIYLSPNPTLNETVLNLVAAHYHIQVIDVYGNVIDKRDSKGHEVFQTETWKPGLYFIEVQEEGSERILTGKLVVTKE